MAGDGTGGSSVGGSTGGSMAGGSMAGGSSVGGGSAGNAAAGSGGGGGSAGHGGAAASGSAGFASRGGQAGSAGGETPTPAAICPEGALFCEGFESFATLAPLNGRFISRSEVGSSATVVVDTLQAHSGSKAVHFYSPSIDSTQKAYIFTQAAPFPVVADQLYVRFMMYIKRYMHSPSTSTHARIAWVGPADVLLAGANGAAYTLATYNGLGIERILDPNKGWQRDTSQKMEATSRQGRWQCIEFELDNQGGVPLGEKAGSTMTPHIWQEGTELTLAPGGTSDVWAPVHFEALQFSLWSGQADPLPVEYWLDDIVVSTERINCPG